MGDGELCFHFQCTFAAMAMATSPIRAKEMILRIAHLGVGLAPGIVLTRVIVMAFPAVISITELQGIWHAEHWLLTNIGLGGDPICPELVGLVLATSSDAHWGHVMC